MPEGQQAARFVRIIMPGERVVWIPPERLCTGTKEWKRSSVILEIREEVGVVTWVKWSRKGCISNVTTMEFVKMSTMSFSSKSNAKDQQQ